MKNLPLGIVAGFAAAAISYLGIVPLDFGIEISVAIAIAAGLGLCFAISKRGAIAIWLAAPGLLMGIFVALGMYWITGSLDSSAMLKLIGLSFGPVTVVATLLSLFQSSSLGRRRGGD